MSIPTYLSTDARILRLAVLAIDAKASTQNIHTKTPRTITQQEAEDLGAILDELHRLHNVIAAETAKARRLEKKSRAQKPAAARSHAATTHTSTPKEKKHGAPKRSAGA